MHAKGSLSCEQRAAIVGAARECLGTPFHFNERKPGQAIDCVGLIRHAMQRSGLYCPPDLHYSTRTCFGEHVYLDARDSMDEVSVDDIGIGTVVLLWLSRPHQPQHLGIWTGESLVHAHGRARRVIETHGGASYASQVFAAFDMRTAVAAAHRVEGFNGRKRIPGQRKPDLSGKNWRDWCGQRCPARDGVT